MRYVIFSLIFGFLSILFPYHAISQVYYCGESAATGFNLNKKTKSYDPTKFKTDKFIINFDSVKTMTMKIRDQKDEYSCTIPNFSFPKQMSCYLKLTPYMFNFDAESGRFVYARGFGYAFGDHDSVIISYGVCEAF